MSELWLIYPSYITYSTEIHNVKKNSRWTSLVIALAIFIPLSNPEAKPSSSKNVSKQAKAYQLMLTLPEIGIVKKKLRLLSYYVARLWCGQ